MANLLTLKESAEKYRISIWTFRSWVYQQKRLDCVKQHGQLGIDEDELLAVIARSRSGKRMARDRGEKSFARTGGEKSDQIIERPQPPPIRTEWSIFQVDAFALGHAKDRIDAIDSEAERRWKILEQLTERWRDDEVRANDYSPLPIDSVPALSVESVVSGESIPIGLRSRTCRNGHTSGYKKSGPTYRCIECTHG